MATRVPLTPQQAQGFDLLIALGLSPLDSRGRRPPGCAAPGPPVHRRAGVVRPGMPTNNTSEERTGARGPLPRGELCARPRALPREGRQRRLHSFLGARCGSIALGRVGGAEGREQAGACHEPRPLARHLGLLPRPDDGRGLLRGCNRVGPAALHRAGSGLWDAAAPQGRTPALWSAAGHLPRALGPGRGGPIRRPDGDRAAQASRALARLARRGASGRARQ